ncbi:15-hydroxyprostaglandin dehydrogenase [Trichonephila clavipes]|uniref:15-hydroxyprostaglandin dehydrogenase n=1 Tax=Trichonephila clavipes TaxID=2585209 RepID=A0A8X6SWT7_TRICX|nr:15-hydroxyprostaglandin dehydrogenase [Trichonephila clavipes]
MATSVLADPTRALQGTNRGSGPVMEESENEVGSLEQLLLYAVEHCYNGNLPLRDHLGKVLHGVEENHQRNVGPLREPGHARKSKMSKLRPIVYETYII